MKGLFKQLHTHIEKIANNELGTKRSQDKEAILQALFHKEAGNKCLLDGLIDEAIMHYTKSIYLNPENHIVYTNRATAFKKHNEFQHQYDDALVALTLNPKYFKAFLRFGEACIEVGKLPIYTDIQFIDKGIKNLQKALYLCWKLDSTDPNYAKREIFQKEIGQQILQAKKIKWFKEQEIRENDQDLMMCQLEAVLSDQQQTDENFGENLEQIPYQENDLFEDHLVNCDDDIAEEREQSVRIGQQFRTNAQRLLLTDIFDEEQNAPGRARGESEDVENLQNLDTNNSVSIMKDETPKPDNSQLSYEILTKVSAFFEAQNKQNDLRTLDVPDYLLCRISDEMMDQPVIIQSGFTYEKEQIKKHFQMNGNFDPMTRQEIDPNVMILNRNIKQASAEYLVQNPWAFEHIPGQKLSDLHM